MRLRKSGTSSATYLLMFMSRSVRIMRYTCGRQAGAAGEAVPHSTGAQQVRPRLRLAALIRRCPTPPPALLTSLFSGLARLEAPAVRSTLRMLRRPKS